MSASTMPGTRRVPAPWRSHDVTGAEPRHGAELLETPIRPQIVAGPEGSNAPLPLLLAILAEFERRKVSYCYWKSSRRIDSVLRGDSDLDLLIARDDQHRAQAILLELGVKRFADVAGRDHPAVSSYLGHDEASGRIVHLHLHFRLVLGEKLFKNWRLPWEATILHRVQSHPTLPIRLLDPASEALLLVTRAALELNRLDPVLLRHSSQTKHKFELDRQKLAALLDPEDLRKRAAEVFSGDVVELIVRAFFGTLPLDRLGRLRRRVRAQLAPHRAFNAVEARVRSAVRAVLWVAGGLNQRAVHAPRPLRRRAPGGGCVIAVIGIDGSGKSSVVSAIREWLQPEIDIMPVYFGTGDGRPALFLLPLKLIAPLIARLLGTKPRGASHGQVSNRAPGLVYSLMMTVWATAVAAEKRTKLRAAHRAATRGLVVVTDRYPQSEDANYNDGPLLPRLQHVPGWLRRFEMGTYARAARLGPDLVLKLEVTPETAARREPDMDPVIVRERIKMVHYLTFHGLRIVHIDAERPLAEVISSVKREIWRLL